MDTAVFSPADEVIRARAKAESLRQYAQGMRSRAQLLKNKVERETVEALARDYERMAEEALASKPAMKARG